ncbi:hypothetical protein [Melghirimyces algeriensis]|uniref:Uncharacterized protein n=1 Tax=Melghirimyces algeriensis TaxID=910412 RepID=A0A521BHL0_9BACL|nr:hypothetical protein [Melghirimyces algeriensis]SMO46575.1 hypothetical protein SAMN06264849_102109 [Melghirimyces algeriensis]
MKKRSSRVLISKTQNAKRWAWLKDKMEQLEQRLPQQSPSYPPGPPQNPEYKRRDQEERERPEGFDDFGLDAPFGPPPPMDESPPMRKKREKQIQRNREPHPEDWWDGPMMDWGEAPEEEIPPWERPPRNRDDRREEKRGSRQEMDPWEEPGEKDSRPKRSRSHDWEELPNMFDETDTVKSSSRRRKRYRTKRRR